MSVCVSVCVCVCAEIEGKRVVRWSTGGWVRWRGRGARGVPHGESICSPSGAPVIHESASAASSPSVAVLLVGPQSLPCGHSYTTTRDTIRTDSLEKKKKKGEQK